VDDRVDEIFNLEIPELRSELGDVRVAVSCSNLQRKRFPEVEEQLREVVVRIAE